MDSTQPRMDFESKEDVDSPHLPLCARQGLQVKFCYSCQSSWESLVLIMKSFRKKKKRKALTMQLAFCSNNIKIYYGWRVTFELLSHISIS